MAESRRVPLTTLRRDDEAPPVPKAPSRRCAPRADGGARPADADTVRLVVTLFEADERRFPEFSYSQLIAERDQINDSKDKVPQSTFEEEEEREDDEVAAIARKLEEKYGGKPKKKKDRIQDLIDIGYGYDDEDSFIDNSEAYDEFVPASITTKFGGFYVNSGVLQFRQTSDTETEDLTTQDPSKKRKLDGGRDKPKKKPCREAEETNGNMDSTGPNEEMKRKKKRKSVCTLSVTSMLKKFQREKEKERLKAEKANYRAAGITVVPRIPLCPADAAGGGGSGLTDPLLSLIGSTDDQALIQAASTMDFDIDLVSLLDAKQVALVSEGGSTSPRQCAPLPEGLTPGLEEDDVREPFQVVKSSEGESKLKFFTPEINSILLDIELQCRGQGVQLRSRLYTHLSSFLPCSRDTLLKRVKKLLLTHTVSRLQCFELYFFGGGISDTVEPVRCIYLCAINFLNLTLTRRNHLIWRIPNRN
uniref:Ubinuclein-1-like n=1 Tax=Scophthalmus maximus TaxID=52904 RepID=A0A8D3BIF7_SCOMX